MKSSPSYNNQAQTPGSNEIFVREVFIYETVFQQFAEFQEECNISNAFTSYPELLKTGEELLFMEDMVEKGYQMHNKKNTMNSSHLEAIIKEYAKFQSISLAMNKKDPGRFKNLTKDLFDIFESMDKRDENTDFSAVLKPMMSHLYEAVKDDLVATEVLKIFEKQMSNKDAYKIDPQDMTVVTHGDCWCNNFLFKYKDDDKERPSRVCIIDWQLSKLGCPATDLTYCLLANGSKEVLDDYQRYLKIYHEALSLSLKEFGFDPEEVYPYQILEKQFKKYSPLMLFLCVIVMRVLICEQDEAPDFAKIDIEKKRF